MSSQMTQEKLEVLRLARDGKPLSMGYDRGLSFGDDLKAAYGKRLKTVSLCVDNGWIERGRLSAKGEEVLSLFERPHG
jgi:hypothetical protein